MGGSLGGHTEALSDAFSASGLGTNEESSSDSGIVDVTQDTKYMYHGGRPSSACCASGEDVERTVVQPLASVAGAKGDNTEALPSRVRGGGSNVGGDLDVDQCTYYGNACGDSDGHGATSAPDTARRAAEAAASTINP